MELTEHIQIEGVAYERIRTRRNGTCVYKSEDGQSFARCGDKAAIELEYATHLHLEELGFPVAEVLAYRTDSGQAFFIERSLGETHIGGQFDREYQESGQISDETFDRYLTVVKKFAAAQAGTGRTDLKDWQACAEGIHLDDIMAERPDATRLLKDAFSKAQHIVADLPWVVTHGDFNPHNIFPGGVIDFEDHFHAPLGHDLVTAAAHIAWFPVETTTEYYAKYQLTAAQRSRCIESFAVFAPVDRAEIFAAYVFMRGCWSAAHMGEWPKLQKWRFELLDSVAKRLIQGEDLLGPWLRTGSL